MRQPQDYEPGRVRQGWQHEAASRVERVFQDAVLMPRLASHEQALLRSQSGPTAGAPLTCVPTSPLLHFDPQLFRILLLRRLSLPLPLTSRVCRCGRQIDPFGHHRAACSRAGVLGRRGYAVESAAARVCREAGARVTTNVMLRDLDLFLPQGPDGRRLEVVADGLPMFDGAQLAVDTTLASPLHCDGSARPGAPSTNGVALSAARRRKERAYPEPVGPHRRARLVVLAGEVGGRWSEETRSFISQLAKAKSRAEPFVLRRRVEQAWRLRWGAMLSCAAARVFASSLLERLTAMGSDGATPLSHEVEGNFRHSGVGA